MLNLLVVKVKEFCEYASNFGVFNWRKVCFVCIGRLELMVVVGRKVVGSLYIEERRERQKVFF
ncbi:hypothetical protein HanPSC8_Chr14g0611831 [Helianthus annuus]|nr:hypothetical protein HanPSC8_Chr14g0611831 [Helianthus annuus]